MASAELVEVAVAPCMLEGLRMDVAAIFAEDIVVVGLGGVYSTALGVDSQGIDDE